MENLSTHASLSRKTASLLLCFLMAGSSVLALVPTALGTISVDQIAPVDGTISISNPYMPVNANITTSGLSTVMIDSSSDWLAGTIDNSLTVGAQGSLQLREIQRDDFDGTGDLDSSLWTWNDFAVQGTITGAVSLDTNLAAGNDSTAIWGTHMFPLSTMDGLYLNASASLRYGGSNDSIINGESLFGWYSPGPSTSYASIVWMEDGAGNYNLDLIAQDDFYGFQSGMDNFSTITINPGSFENYRMQIVDAASGNITGEWYDANAQVWISLGFVHLNLSMFGPYVTYAGTVDPSVDDWGIDLDFMEVSTVIYASGGTYVSAPLDTGLFPGSRISRITLATANGQFNGIGSAQWRTSANDTGPWTTFATAPLNIPIDLAPSTWIQLRLSLSNTANPSWPDSITVDLSYPVDVGAYFVDDLPGSGSINTNVWSPSSNAVTAEGLDLNSGSAGGSIGVTYRNTTWLMSDTHTVRSITAIRVVNGDNLVTGGAADTNVLLSGFTASDGSSQTGYAGVVRVDDGASPYWGVVWDDGTGRHLDYQPENMILTSGQAFVQVTLVDGVFHGWVLETDNAWRGWLDLGSFDWGATPGTASWRIGDIGTHSGSQRAVLDWVALLMKPMTPVFGASWTAGNVNINENQNTRAVIALEGPTFSMQLVNYRLDTTPPVGSMTLNGANPYTRLLTVDLGLSATDLWGVRYYAASESLSFPEGWQPMTASTTFSLSPGDGRKVVWVRYMDSSGVESQPINQSVILDSQNPSGAIYVANRSAYSNVIDVPVTMLAFDGNGVDTLYLSNDAGMANKVAYDVNTGTPPTSSSETRTWSLTPGDGTKTVYFQVEDVSGRLSPVYNDSILVDTTEPGLTVTISNGVVRGNTTYVNTPTLRLNVVASDASGVDEVDVSEFADFSEFDAYPGAGLLTYDVPAVSGAKTLYVRAFDIYNLQSEVRRLDFFVDVNAPTGSIEIIYTGQSMSDFLLNVQGCCNDTSLAKARGVVLVVGAVDNVLVSEVEFSTSLYFPGAVWQPFTAGRYYFELSANDGTDKTVYVRFRDVNGNPSQAFFDQIDMDTTPPIGSIIVNSGDLTTIDPLLSLSLEASDNFEGDLQMRLSLTPDFAGSTWLPFADSARFDARTTAGEVTVYYQVRDSHGWESLTYNDKITVRQATCQELNNCIGPATPGFEGPAAVIALVAVGAVALMSRRKRTL